MNSPTFTKGDDWHHVPISRILNQVTIHDIGAVHVDTMRWCRMNIKGEWTWRGNETLGKYNTRNYYFKDKSEAMLFKLTWSGK